ncbi:MAG: hypothetical protein ACLQU9_03840 [Acidimicrobiales bacterium]|jgi:hypothetical protein
MSRRTRSTSHPLTRQVARQAGEFGRAARTRQAHSLGRAVPAARHPDYVDVQIKTRLVRQAAAVVDRDPELVPWLAGRLRAAQAGPGRPAALPLRSALICFWLLAVTQRNFFFINLAPLVGSLSWRVRRELGIDYTDRAGRPKQISYEQLLRTFHAIAEAFDPYQEGIDEDEARSRAAELQALVNRLVRASSAEVAHSGDYAIDATLKWAYERPRTAAGRRGLNDKIDRRGKDGEAGPPLTLSAVIDADADGDLEEAGLLRDPLDERKMSRYDQRTWGGGAGWVGRKNKTKGVFGYALHTATVSDPRCPNVIDALVVTTAKALPAPSIMPAMRDLYDARLGTGVTKPLGDVVADPAYSANPADWQLPLRAMGASSWFRLHRTNQGGFRSFVDHLFVDGRPCCPCAAYALEHRSFPTFPYTGAQLTEYQRWATLRARFEMKPNGTWHPDRGRQFFAVHYERHRPAGTPAGGCEHCVDRFGDPVIDPLTNLPRPRCCTQGTKKLSAAQLGLYQEASFGSEEWFDKWNPRNRVEGSYGVLKNLALVNWGRDYHHFVGLARESVVAAFAVMAYNFHAQRTFAAKLARIGERERNDDELRRRRGPRRAKILELPSAQPTKTFPGGIGSESETARPVSGPKGLEFLGTPQGP